MQPQVFWFYGPTGSGKTLTVMHMSRFTYRVFAGNDFRWSKVPLGIQVVHYDIDADYIWRVPQMLVALLSYNRRGICVVIESLCSPVEILPGSSDVFDILKRYNCQYRRFGPGVFYNVIIN